jgi:subfamily B ATP-binding cassette protein MsbA
VAANIALWTARRPDERKFAARQPPRLAHDLPIERLPEGYETIIGDRGVNLAAAAPAAGDCARLKNAPILILDEAIAPDTESEMLVQKALANLMEHRTVIVIAHRLSTIRRAQRSWYEKGAYAKPARTRSWWDTAASDQRLHELQFESAGIVVDLEHTQHDWLRACAGRSGMRNHGRPEERQPPGPDLISTCRSSSTDRRAICGR